MWLINEEAFNSKASTSHATLDIKRILSIPPVKRGISEENMVQHTCESIMVVIYCLVIILSLTLYS